MDMRSWTSGLSQTGQSQRRSAPSHGLPPDLKCSLQAHIEALQRGLGSADLILTTGGTSMGVGDLLKPVIEHHLGGTVHFGRVRVKPGKPTTFATIPTPGGKTERVPLFALPGNPASALVTFHVFLIPALRKLGGVASGSLPSAQRARAGECPPLTSHVAELPA